MTFKCLLKAIKNLLIELINYVAKVGYQTEMLGDYNK